MQCSQPRGNDPLRKTATWNWPDVTIYEQQLLSYLEQREVVGLRTSAAVEDYLEADQPLPIVARSCSTDCSMWAG